MAVNRGKIVIVGIFAIAFAGAIIAFFSQRADRDQALAFWGVEAGLAVRDAKTVEFLQFGPPPTADAPPPENDEQFATLFVAGQELPVRRSIDITDSPGVIKARLALIEDRAFAFDAPPPPGEPQWNAAIRFRHKELVVTCALDVERNLLYCVESQKQVSVAPIKTFLRHFVNDQNKAANAAAGE
ncbi:MAG: hypothetical protein QGG36_18465 [Pirellulaceae bacterium]|jgi:hypothetical protein|nr:hypothetical protein [Pirellulaceae bacterium]MDP7017795.1 hypothetical protein [Pirellulaceae bacterium]